MTELEENIAVDTQNGEVDEEMLKKCLEVAESSLGKEKLRELIKKEEIARTRTYIRGYAKRALEGWTDF